MQSSESIDGDSQRQAESGADSQGRWPGSCQPECSACSERLIPECILARMMVDELLAAEDAATLESASQLVLGNLP